jgi:hypothetical protein
VCYRRLTTTRSSSWCTGRRVRAQCPGHPHMDPTCQRSLRQCAQLPPPRCHHPAQEERANGRRSRSGPRPPRLRVWQADVPCVLQWYTVAAGSASGFQVSCHAVRVFRACGVGRLGRRGPRPRARPAGRRVTVDRFRARPVSAGQAGRVMVARVSYESVKGRETQFAMCVWRGARRRAAAGAATRGAGGRGGARKTFAPPRARR